MPGPTDESKILKKTTIIAKPFIVVDVAVGDFFDELVEGRTDVYRRWNAATAGSSLHRMLRNDNKSLLIIATRAATATETEVAVYTGEVLTSLGEIGRNTLDLIILRVFFSIEQIISDREKRLKVLRESRPDIYPEQKKITAIEFQKMTPPPKRRGPDPAPYNAWARDQARQGRKLDDPEFLTEYMAQRGDITTDELQRKKAHEALRKTIERERK